MSVLIDNGGGLVKFGFSGSPLPTVCISNVQAETRSASKKCVIGDTKIKELNVGYNSIRPVQAGCLIDVDTQVNIWNHGISSLLGRNSTTRGLHVTIIDHLLAPVASYRQLFQGLFEGMGVASCAVIPAQVVNQYATPEHVTLENAVFVDQISGFKHYTFTAQPKPEIAEKLQYAYDFYCDTNWLPDATNPCRLNIDVGATGCTVTPSFESMLIESGFHRNFTGGIAAVRELKKLINYRSLKVDGEDMMVEAMWRQGCMFSPTLEEFPEILLALAEAKRAISKDLAANRVEIVDPMCIVFDPSKKEIVTEVRNPNCIALGSELTAVPEMIFNPNTKTGGGVLARNEEERALMLALEGWSSDTLGKAAHLVQVKNAMGVVDMAVHSVQCLPPILQRGTCSKMAIGGGIVQMPNFMTRFLNDIKSSLPEQWPKGIIKLKEHPEYHTWIGGNIWSHMDISNAAILTKKQYEDLGMNKF